MHAGDPYVFGTAEWLAMAGCGVAAAVLGWALTIFQEWAVRKLRAAFRSKETR